jgi:hypothetical protein
MEEVSIFQKRVNKITNIHEVAAVLAGIDHELAPLWLHNDLIKKNLAVSYDYWLEDTNISMTLRDFCLQYLALAPYLGEMFSMDIDT